MAISHGDVARVTADEMVPPAAYALWTQMVPHHGITIVAGLREEGQEAIHVVYNTDTPPWVLIGLLESVKSDLIALWQDSHYSKDEDPDDID